MTKILYGNFTIVGNFTKKWQNLLASMCETYKYLKRTKSDALLSDLHYYGLKRYVKPVSEVLPRTLYGGRYTITLIPGSGIGPELMDSLQQVLEHIQAPIEFEVIKKSQTKKDIKYAILSIIRNGVCIKGNLDRIPEETDLFASPNLALRKILNLYCNFNLLKSYKGIGKFDDLNIVVVKQNTEGSYMKLEHDVRDGSIVESMKIITRESSEKIAHWACQFCKMNRRKKITIVHKANIMKLSDGLFLRSCRDICEQYENIEVTDMIVDNCCMQLVSNPRQFDVILTPNLYGTIMTNVICGLIGGPGLMSGINYGDHHVVYEGATRNSGTKIAGKNIANPIAILNCCVDMLYHLNLKSYGHILEDSIQKTLMKDQIFTPDLGGNATTTDVVEKVIANANDLRNKLK